MKSFLHKFLFLLSISFMPVFIFSVKAGTLEDNLVFNSSISSIGNKTFDNINQVYVLNANTNHVTLSSSLKFDLLSTSNVSLLPGDQQYYYLTINYCSSGDQAFYDMYSSYDNKIYDIVDTGVSCSASQSASGKVFIMFVQMKLSFFDDDDSGQYAYRLYFQPSFGLRNNDSYLYHIRFLDSRIFTYDNFLKVYQEYEAISNQVKIINKNQELIDKQTETNSNLNDLKEKQDQTNSKIDDVKDSITSEDSPKLDGLSNSAGWLPAGPLDSILNLPLSFLQNLFTNLSKTCQPVTLTLPYVNESIELPCLNTIYSQISGLSTWINSIGVIASAFMLFSYLIKLYKWVDDTLTFRENNYIDNWGGI